MPLKFLPLSLLKYSVLMVLFVPLAQAHTPYLKPASFKPVMGNYVTLDAAFGEKLFIPEVAFNGKAFSVIHPNGEKHDLSSLIFLKTRAVLEHKLEDKGTYRFSTGRRLGAEFYTYELNGKTKRAMNPAEPLPKEAKITSHVQAITKAESYVTYGAPTSAALKSNGEDLELVALSHPSEIYTGEAFDFAIQFQGKPLKDQKVELFETGNGAPSRKAAMVITTNNQGKATLKVEKAGIYLLRTRHRSAAPKGAKAPVYSYTYSLTFEVAPSN